MRHTLTLPLGLLLFLGVALAGCSLSPEERAAKKREMYAEADALREDARHGQERGVYDDLISLDEQDARAYFRRGTTYMREAVAAKREIVGEEAKGAAISRYLKAIEEFDQAIERQPNLYASAYFCRGECNREIYTLGMGVTKEEKYLRRALADYRKATQINRLHPQANRALGYLCHFVVDVREAKIKAITYYKRHLEAVGSDRAVELWLEKLVAAYGDPDVEKAQKAAEQPDDKPADEVKPEGEPPSKKPAPEAGDPRVPTKGVGAPDDWRRGRGMRGRGGPGRGPRGDRDGDRGRPDEGGGPPQAD